MKKTFLLFSMVLVFASIFGQPAIGVDQPVNELLQQPYAMIVLPYSPQVIIAAMKNYQHEKPANKSTVDNHRAYQSFQETSLVRYNFDDADIIFEVGLKNPNNKNESFVYLLLNSPTEENNISRNQIHFDVGHAKSYLDNLAIAIVSYASKQQIKLQTSELAKADAKQLDLVNCGNKLDSKKAAQLLRPVSNSRRTIKKTELLDRQIAENKSEQAIQKLEIEKQKAELKVLMAGERANPESV